MSNFSAHIRVSEITIWKICECYVQSSLDSLVGRKKRNIPPRPSIVTNDVEAHVIAIYFSAPPAGKANGH